MNLASPKVKQGANLTYVATTTNFGPSSAQGVAISNTIPAGTTYLSVFPVFAERRLLQQFLQLCCGHG